MKKILVPVDFSEYSEYALEVAAQIAKQQNASIIIFHMVGISESVLSKSELEEQEEAKYYIHLAKEKIKTFTDKPYLEGIEVKTILQNLKIFSEIDLVAKEQSADLIVMGSHGISGLKTVFVGSNTEKVIRTAQVPVIVIKRRRPSFDVKNIVFAFDLKQENANAFKAVQEFAKTFSATLHLVYINTVGINYMSNSQIQQKIDAFLALIGEEIPIKIYNDYSVELGIFNYANDVNADMVAIPTHGRRGLAHFFIGSIGESVANQSSTPIMTVKI
jgi:nucleotide-binding universal stress UspA family protein